VRLEGEITRRPGWLTPRAGDLLDGRAEGFAAGLEVGELVEGGAGRRQQDDRVLARGGGVGVGGAARRPPSSRTPDDRRLALQGLAKARRASPIR
jgi:hypothetical protein